MYMTYLIWLWDQWAVDGSGESSIGMAELCREVIRKNRLDFTNACGRFWEIEDL
jgi:hypothetical protein